MEGVCTDLKRITQLVVGCVGKRLQEAVPITQLGVTMAGDEVASAEVMRVLGVQVYFEGGLDWLMA